MLADAPDRGGERLQQQLRPEELLGVAGEPVDGRVLVATVEVAQEVAPVAPVEGEQSRGLARAQPW